LDIYQSLEGLKMAVTTRTITDQAGSQEYLVDLDQSLTLLQSGGGDIVFKNGLSSDFKVRFSNKVLTFSDPTTGERISIQIAPPARGAAVTETVSFLDGDVTFRWAKSASGANRLFLVGVGGSSSQRVKAAFSDIGSDIFDVVDSSPGKGSNGKFGTPSVVDGGFKITSDANGPIVEGNKITFTVTPSKAVTADATLVVTVDGDTGGAIANKASGSDFIFQDGIQTVSFKAGDTAAKTVVVTVNNDGVTEGLEAYRAILTDASGKEVSSIPGTIQDGAPPTQITQADLKTFTLVAGQTAGPNVADVMRLTGAQTARIDFTNTNSDSQVKGLDLNGNGFIDRDGIENNSPPVNGGPVTGFEIVDAYARNPLNEFDTKNNFLGDIAFDGTGFEGDGVSTDGNVYLGGLGVDTALGGVGNDFMTGGGVASSRFVRQIINGISHVIDTHTNQDAVLPPNGLPTNSNVPGDSLSGGRNADFFFTELSLLDPTDGNALAIDGGVTADDNSAGNTLSLQDSDWLLLEASDDDEPVTVTLEDHLADENGNGNPDDDGAIVTRAGQALASLQDVENVDASGNFYRFIDGVDVALGGRAALGAPAATDNDGIGSSAQLIIAGTIASNKLIAGYDNDVVFGGANNDLLMGGNLHKLINPNLLNIVNDGRDELIGDAGADDIVFETDGGVYEGGSIQGIGPVGAPPADDGTDDTLWLSDKLFGQSNAATATTDGIVRLDLLDGRVGGLDNAAGYGGADQVAATGNYTADQTNYKADGPARAQVQDFENVIATGLGAIDYDTDGANNGELNHVTRMNFAGHQGDMTLRGTENTKAAGDPVDNILYANTGNDVLEGRSGDDRLSGGDGNDDFVFWLQDGTGDGVDVIHRQADADKDGFWDNYSDATRVGTFVQDFGVNSTTDKTASALTVDFGTTSLADPNVALTSFSIVIGGTTFAVADATTLAAAQSADEVAAIVNAAYQAIDPTVSARAVGNTVVVTDQQGRDISDTVGEGYLVGLVLANGSAQAAATFSPAGAIVTQDRLIYRAYEDRKDGESIDDNAYLGSKISLGKDAYAEDLVVDFNTDGTRIAEDQSYALNFLNLTTEDLVTVNVNDVKYTLRVGHDLDGQIIDGENSQSGATQVAIQDAFLARLATYITTFLDNDTAAGQVLAVHIAGTNTVTLTQVAYTDAEETVFMRTPIVTLSNDSGGEPASVAVANASQHEAFLFQFDGRNNNLNETNVQFYGTENISRSNLATAKNDGGMLLGKDAQVVYVLNTDKTDDIGAARAGEALNGKAIEFNAIANPLLNTGIVVDYSVHGDDQLIGGNGADTVLGGTGDDRVYGSRGADSLDGGKDLYLVTDGVRNANGIDGEIRVLNNFDAKTVDENPATIKIDKLLQNETGVALEGGFEDTLIYQQRDFGTVGQGGAQFYITLDSDVQQKNGGAGTVDVTENGVNAGRTAFTNFEHIRTVSGDGTHVGQGRDTLDFAALSTTTGGVFYNLSNNTANDDNTAGDGDNKAGADNFTGWPAGANLNKAGPGAVITNFGDNWDFFNDNSKVAAGETPVNPNDPFVSDSKANDVLFATVDGVENVIGGQGDDGVYVDETEADKDNLFDLDGTPNRGNDIVIYGNAFDQGPLAQSSQVPTVTLKVNSGADTDTVEMTHGRVGSEIAIDALINVEAISFAADADNLDAGTGGAAASSREDDVLDVSGVNGATVDYTNGYITSGGVVELSGQTQLILFGAAEFEQVKGSAGNDTLVIADAMLNSREDAADGALPKDISFDSYLNYNLVNDFEDNKLQPADADTNADDVDNDGQVYDRMSLAELRVIGKDGADVNPNGENQIPEIRNEGLFTYSLAGGADTVDYSNEAGTVAAVINFAANATEQRVMVDNNGNENYSDAGDRVDVLTGAESIVASRGESIIDLTNSTTNSRVLFSFNFPNLAANLVEGVDKVTALDREIHNVRIEEQGSQAALGNVNLLEYTDLGASAAIAQPMAVWTQVEGSDRNEYVELTDHESDANHTLLLRGGDNEANYNELFGGGINAQIGLAAFDKANPLASGLINVNVTFSDADGIFGGADAPKGVDFVSSHTAGNLIAPGSLRIEASQTQFDRLAFATGLGALDFKLGVTNDNTITVSIGEGTVSNVMTLTGFENLLDPGTNDTYTIDDLQNVLANLKLVDSAANDRDTLVANNNAVDFDVAPADTIDLKVLNDKFAFDFDVLDVTPVTRNNLTLLGDTVAARDTTADGTGADDLVLGNLSLVKEVGGFEDIYLTNASIASSGASFILDTDNTDLLRGDGSKLFDVAAGGLVAASGLDASRVTGTNLTLSTKGAAGVSLVGGAGADTLVGGQGSDELRGGKGNDTLDGGIIPAKGAVVSVTLPGTDGAGATSTLGAAGATIAIGGVTLTAVAVPSAANQVGVNADADQVGAAFAAQSLATWRAALAGNGLFAGAAGNEDANQLTSVTYDTASNKLLFTFAASTSASLVDASDIAATAGGTIVPAVGNEVVFAPQGESVDTYVFEATAADNGVDNIVNFSNGAVNDILDFGLFLGRDVTAAGIVGPVNGIAAGVDLTGKDVAVIFNQAADLTAANLSATPAAGKISIGDNGSAVVLATADADGVADATDDGYKAYYVWDADATAGVSLRIQLVDPIKSSAGQDIPAAGLASPAHFIPSFVPPTPTFAVAPGAATVDEGQSATFTLTTTNVAAGAAIPFTVGGQVNAADIVGGALTGAFTVGANGTATATVALANDLTTEGTETLTLTLGAPSNGESANVTVNDTSLGTKVQTVNVTAANVGPFAETAATDTTFNLAAGNYTASVAGFGTGDKLAFPAGASLSVVNNSATDGAIVVTGTVGGQLVTLNLTGVDAAKDGQVFSVNSFNAAFGANSLTAGGAGGGTPVNVPVTGGNATPLDASAADNNFGLAAGNYTFNVAGFAAGDKLAFPAGSALSVVNNSATDGVIDVTGAVGGQLIQVHMTGVAAASDGGVFSVNSFNAVFGAGSLA
jgi:hypothetical protein